jgi:hypothetical protein
MRFWAVFCRICPNVDNVRQNMPLANCTGTVLSYVDAVF